MNLDGRHPQSLFKATSANLTRQRILLARASPNNRFVLILIESSSFISFPGVCLGETPCPHQTASDLPQQMACITHAYTRQDVVYHSTHLGGYSPSLVFFADLRLSCDWTDSAIDPHMIFPIPLSYPRQRDLHYFDHQSWYLPIIPYKFRREQEH